MQRPNRKQIEEWLENPITLVFREIAIAERDECDSARGVDVYHPFEPQKTQEVLAGLNGCVDTWEQVIAALEGEGLMEIDDGEEAILE